MSEARQAFQNLQVVAGRGFDTTSLSSGVSIVERRIVHHRSARMALSAVASTAVACGLTFGVVTFPFGAQAGPSAHSATPTLDSTSVPTNAPDAEQTRAPDVSVFGEPYPMGVDAPDLVELVPGGTGGRLISETSTDYTFGLLRPDPQTHDTVEVPVTMPKGNVLILAATHWECTWIREFVQASEADDADRTAAAAAQLTKFPDLAVVQQYNPELGESDRVSLLPRIVGGDTEFAKRWLNSTCGGISMG